MFEKLKKDKEKILRLGLVIIPYVFYVAFWLHDKVVWCADSASYVEMHDCREPLYPMLLALLRLIFCVKDNIDPTWNISLFAMTFIQTILAAWATVSVSRYLIKRLKLRWIQGYIILIMPLLVSLINRFVAERASMYADSILTEGLTVSIYILAVRYMYEYILEHSKSSLALATVLVGIGILTRKQMVVLLVLLVVSVIVSYLLSDYEKESKHPGMKRAVGTAIIISVCIASVDLLVDCTYNKIVHGVFTIHTEDNRFITTMAMYTADREYVEYVDPEFREIYLKIYDACDNNGWLMKDSPSGWYSEVDHFADNYDHIQLDTMELILEEEVKKMDSGLFDENMTTSMKVDSIRSSLNRSLLPHEIPKLFKVFFNNFCAGLVDTVAKRNRPLCIYSLFVYLAYMFSLIKCIKISKEAAIFGGLVLLSTLGNVALVSAVIFCQTRYTIYNMPLFYIALSTMVYEYIRV